MPNKHSMQNRIGCYYSKFFYIKEYYIYQLIIGRLYPPSPLVYYHFILIHDYYDEQESWHDSIHVRGVVVVETTVRVDIPKVRRVAEIR